MTSIEFSDFKLDLYLSHKSFGLLVLVLLVLRIFFFVFLKKPKAIKSHKKWEKALAHSVHLLLYGSLLLMPLSGWVMSSAGDYTVQFFGLHLPDIVEKDEALFERANAFHAFLSYALIISIVLHALGALKHHIIDKDETLRRMTYNRIGVLGSLFILFILAVWGIVVLKFVYEDYKKERVLSEQRFAVSTDVSTPETDVVSSVAEWSIDPEQSFMRFESAQYGQSYTGEFQSFDGQIFFDSNALEESKVRILVDISSLKTGSFDRDEQTLSSAWFDASQYPKAVFEADDFKHLGNDQYEAVGTLRVRDVSTAFTLPFSLNITNGIAQMKAKFEINRLTYNVGVDQSESANSYNVSFNVQVLANQI